MECYGTSFNKRKDCAECKLRKWCRDASDPPKLSHQMLEWDMVSELTVPSNMTVMHPSDALPSGGEKEERLYSRSELLEVIAFLLALDTQTLDMLDCKVGNPGISFSEMARQRGVSRQAVHKFIKKKCSQIPELSIILQNNSQKRKFSKKFLEEVCRIRKQTSEKRLKKQKAGLKFSRKLICWNQSLDLSKMSIFKGSNITGNALKA
ncbi:MAG: hypothetical protein PHV82_04135 [Victivallaceae bacterium]|nr:hypothetical protein [Victivallaceae bacterium]